MAAKEVISALPAPWVDITKTKYFMTFPSPGGPLYDAALHNQAAMIKMLQAVRKDLSSQMPFDEIKQKHRWTYTDEVMQIMAIPHHVKYLVDTAELWQFEEGNGMVLTRSEQLPAMADSLFSALKATFDASDWDDPEVIIDDTHRHLVTMLRKIGGNNDHKQDLELAIAHWIKDNDRQLKQPDIKRMQSRVAPEDSPPSAGPSTLPESSTRGTGSGQRTSSTSGTRSNLRAIRGTQRRGGQRTSGGSRSSRASAAGGDAQADMSRTGADDTGHDAEEEDQATPKARRGSMSTGIVIDLTSEDDASETTVLHHNIRVVDPESVDASGDGEHVVFDDDD